MIVYPQVYTGAQLEAILRRNELTAPLSKAALIEEVNSEQAIVVARGY